MLQLFVVYNLCMWYICIYMHTCMHVYGELAVGPNILQMFIKKKNKLYMFVYLP